MNAEANQSIVANEQSCTVTGLYRIWVGFAAGLLILAYLQNWIALAAWVVLVPLGKWLYIRYFTSISSLFGYGKIKDRAPASVQKAPTHVTFYSALGCPFCPIVLERLQALQKEMDFKLSTIDVSFNPSLLAAKGIRSVPVVEVGEKRMIGNATSKQLAELILLPQASALAS